METGMVGKWSELRRQLKGVALAIWPYLMLELFVPGGTVLAILLFLHRRKLRKARPVAQRSLPLSPARDYGMSGAFTAMAACSVILVLMWAA